MAQSSLQDKKAAYHTVAKAIRFIRDAVRRQPSLAEVAEHVHLSEYHLQRVFSEWAGISPKRFLQFLTKEYTKAALQGADSVLTASMSSGLSSPGRLHDLMISCEALTPGEVKKRGQGVDIGYGFAVTPFGDALIAWTPRGICHLAFCESTTLERERLFDEWPEAKFFQQQAEAERLSVRIFDESVVNKKWRLVLKGTNFQIKVWEALLRVDAAQLTSYGRLAATMGAPKAQRAVGSAVAANKIAVLIPCHRVIRENCDFGHYRWGQDRKVAICAWELLNKTSD